MDLPGPLVVEVFRDIARHYRANRIMMNVTGGEPLLRPDLFDVLSEAHRLGFIWGMVTNGMLVDAGVIEACIRTGMRTVSVSLDGAEETHNWLRNNPLSHKRAVRALTMFAKAGAFEMLEAITCVHRGNIDQLPALYDGLRRMGVDAWRLFTIFPRGRALANPELLPDRDLLQKLLAFIASKRREDPGWPVSYSGEGYLGCRWEREVREAYFYCAAGIEVVGLLANGSYGACPSLAREWAQGSVQELPFSEAWETRYKNMRDRKWMRAGPCGSCAEWKSCRGSSLHLWDRDGERPAICHFRYARGSTEKNSLFGAPSDYSRGIAKGDVYPITDSKPLK